MIVIKIILYSYYGYMSIKAKLCNILGQREHLID